MPGKQKGRLPASTYKFPHSIIALETGVVKDSNTVFLWDGKQRKLKIWERDFTFAEALEYSCLPCYQEIAGKIGTRRMKKELEKLKYGHMDVTEENLRTFWLVGNSYINQFEQVDFLQRFYENQLPVRESTYETIKGMLYLKSFMGRRLSGKTGWAVRNGQNNGWFVGYLENGDTTLYFATNVEPGRAFSMDLFPIVRKEVTEKALKFLLTQ